MKKILIFLVIAVLLTACGKTDELQTQVDDLTAQVEDLQSEVSLCATSLSASEEDLQACLDELESETTGAEVGGGESECAGTERVLTMSTPVLQQAVNDKGKPKYNNNGLMIMTAIPNSRVEDFIAGDVVCVTEHYPVAGGWAVFLISGTREASFNLFLPAHYFEPLPEENVPFVP